jgi:hypothetical protein
MQSEPSGWYWINHGKELKKMIKKIDQHKSDLFVNENTDKLLDASSLVEAIHEYLVPTQNNDQEYLLERINLLRDFFEIGTDSENENAIVLDNLLFGYGKINDVQVLPFDGALEIPDSVDSEAHLKISKQFEGKIQDIKSAIHQIHRAYISYIIMKSISSEMSNKQIPLHDLIKHGLPITMPNPESNDFDY